MSRVCTVCEYSESRVIADTRALGFEEGFRSGSYSRCQIAQWADEQRLAWSQAIREDAEAASARNSAVDAVDQEAALVMSENAGNCPQVRAAVAMSKHTVYLEAPKRTQDLLNVKWALRSAGYSIGSGWHDAEAGVPNLGSEHHWNEYAPA
jgi:hypothetical protein